MRIKHSYKSGLLTLLLTGTVCLLILNLKLKNYENPITEVFHEINTVAPPEQISEKKPQRFKNGKATNRAYNTQKRYKPFKGAYKQVAKPNDFIKERTNTSNKLDKKRTDSKTENKSSSGIGANQITTFKSVNSILKNHSSTSSSGVKNEQRNTNSAIYYSLKNRNDEFLPIPIYLCDTGGKVVINITVTATGRVSNASVNTAASSKNACIKEHALEYAYKARFNTTNTPKQIGTITFIFKD